LLVDVWSEGKIDNFLVKKGVGGSREGKEEAQ